MSTRPSLAEATTTWAQIGINSFGGPAGQIAVLHREVVDEREWIDEPRFLHALNYCMLLPGPEAQQLATYLGWLMHGVRGGLVAGGLFILPGVLIMMIIAACYATLGDISWVEGLLFGVQAGVIAIVASALLRVARRSLPTPQLGFVAAATFTALFLFSVPFPIIIVVAVFLGLIVGARDSSSSTPIEGLPHDAPAARSARRAAFICLLLWLLPVALLILWLGTRHVFAQEAWLFTQTAATGFGGAYAIIGYIATSAVSNGWMSTAEVVTALGLAETTPGPLVLVAQFVGFMAGFNHPGTLEPLLAGLIGGLIAVWVTFLPCFAFVFLGAPSVERLRTNRKITGALSFVSAAVVGVIANLAIWFAIHVLFATTRVEGRGPLEVIVPDVGSIRWQAVAIAIIATATLFVWRRGTLTTIGICALAGITLTLAGAAP